MPKYVMISFIYIYDIYRTKSFASCGCFFLSEVVVWRQEADDAIEQFTSDKQVYTKSGDVSIFSLNYKKIYHDQDG